MSLLRTHLTLFLSSSKLAVGLDQLGAAASFLRTEGSLFSRRIPRGGSLFVSESPGSDLSVSGLGRSDFDSLRNMPPLPEIVSLPSHMGTVSLSTDLFRFPSHSLFNVSTQESQKFLFIFYFITM